MNGSNTKTIIIIVVLIAAAIAAYLGFSGDASSTTSTTLVMPGAPGMQVPTTGGALSGQIDTGQDIAALLSELNRLKIDNTLFDGSDYKALIDYTIIIPSVPIGRQNPFAPIINPATQQTIVATSTPKLSKPKK